MEAILWMMPSVALCFVLFEVAFVCMYVCMFMYVWHIHIYNITGELTATCGLVHGRSGLLYDTITAVEMLTVLNFSSKKICVENVDENLPLANMLAAIETHLIAKKTELFIFLHSQHWQIFQLSICVSKFSRLFMVWKGARVSHFKAISTGILGKLPFETLNVSVREWVIFVTWSR